MTEQVDNSEQISSKERRSIVSLALVFAFRMMGMFMILPVLAIGSQSYEDATPFLMGLAFGAYGITQALLQIPFGIWSDRYGRLPLIVIGLLFFVLGSIVAALSDNIWGVILGRVIQGAGAISAVVMALLADSTREQHRTQAMATIGVSIGISFAIAMVLGPLIGTYAGLKGLFWTTAVLALLSIVIILFIVPKAPQSIQYKMSQVSQGDVSIKAQSLKDMLKHPDLLRLDLGIGILHAILTASFVALPLMLIDLGIPQAEHGWVYLGVLTLGFLGMVPFIIYAEKKRHMKEVLIGAVFVLLFCEFLFGYLEQKVWTLIAVMTLFFIAFNVLEASLPSLISKTAPAGKKGAALGIYSTSQFLGTALGGVLGGVLYESFNLQTIFWGCALLLILWLMAAITMREPDYVTRLRWALSEEQWHDATLPLRVKQVAGVSEVALMEDEQAMYIKVDKTHLDSVELHNVMQNA